MSGCKGFLKFPNIYDLQNKLSLIINRINIEDINFHIKGKTVLDIGCGPNVYYYFPQKAKYCVGLDISEKFIKSAKKRNDNHQIFIPNVTNNLQSIFVLFFIFLQ